MSPRSPRATPNLAGRCPRGLDDLIGGAWPRARRGILLLLAGLLGACASTPPPTPDEGTAADSKAAQTEPESPEPQRPAHLGNPPFYEVDGRRYRVQRGAEGYRAEGVASWYGEAFHGRPTSSGEPFDMHALTAAHPTLPLPTYAEVTHLRNGRQVVVRINDRGPFAKNRLIDLSYAAAQALDMVEAGTAPVEVRALTRATEGTQSTAAPRYYIQIGAFQQAANAERQIEALRSAGFTSAGQITEDGWHRVRLGPFSRNETVEATVQRLASAGFPDYQLIVE